MMSQKFDFVCGIVQSIKDMAVKYNAVIMYDGVVITPEQLVITEDRFYVQIGNCQMSFYWDNEEYDEGFHTEISELHKSITSQIRLFKEIEY
jgi:hypothetical protein